MKRGTLYEGDLGQQRRSAAISSVWIYAAVIGKTSGLEARRGKIENVG